jgi:hypothetical protein
VAKSFLVSLTAFKSLKRKQVVEMDRKNIEVKAKQASANSHRHKITIGVSL